MTHSINIPRTANALGIHRCHTSTVQPGWSYHDHHHSNFEFLYCIDGDATEWVQDKDIRFRSGGCILIKPGIRHSTLNSSPYPLSYLCLFLHIDDIELQKKLFSVDMVHLSEDSINGCSIPQLFRQIHEIMKDYSTNPAIKEGSFILTIQQKLIFESTILLILNEWIQLNDKSGQETKADLDVIRPSVLDLAHKTAKYLEDTVDHNIQIQELAKQWHISRSVLLKSFSKVYGISPREYLSQLKLQRAKELLIHTDLSVESVAEQLGFSSINHFSRQFRRWTGLSPAKFRPMPKDTQMVKK